MGSVLHAAVGIVALVALFLAGYVALPTSWTRYPDPLTNNELAAALSRLGLDAESLTAAGASSAQVDALVDAARGHLEDNIHGLRDVDLTFAAWSAESDRLLGLIQGGKATEADMTAYANAQASLASTTSQRDAALNAAFTAATSGLSAGQIGAINTIRAARAAKWDLPTKYLAGARSESAWVELRDALTAERIASKLGRQTPAGAQAVILAANADPAVSVAAVNLTANLTGNQGTWSSNVFPQ
jgi:hypothetical protein